MQISPLSSNINPFNRIQQNEESNTSCCTRGKLCKIALFFFAALLVGGGIGIVALALKGVVTLDTAWLSLLCFVGAGLLFWQIYKMKDYEDPKSLKEYRIEAAKQTLDASVDEHGWDNLFRYAILPADLFVQKFNESMQKKNLNEALAFHKKATAEYEAQARNHQITPINIPNPARLFAGKWQRETYGLQVCDILDKYPHIDELYHKGTIPEAEFHALKQIELSYNEAKNMMNSVKDSIERLYQTQTQSQQQQFDLIKQSITSEEAALKKVDSLRRQGVFEHGVDTIRNRNDHVPKIRLASDAVGAIFGEGTDAQRASIQERLRQAQANFDRATAPQRLQRDQALARLNERIAGEKERLHTEFMRLLNGA